MNPVRQRWRAPEVVQTSAMDCGPAALKCVLEGHGIHASYGRLREACQTDVDGTSIDALEQVAPELGLNAQQLMLPLNHVLAPGKQAWPAIVVTHLPDGAPHFVVVWRRWGPWLEVMDPASGRRWVRAQAFARDAYLHTLEVPEMAWRAWAATDDFSAPLLRNLRATGLGARDALALLERAASDSGWFSLGALDASVRMVQAVLHAGGLRPGRNAAALVVASYERTVGHSDDIFRSVPRDHWSVCPGSAIGEAMALQMCGAVLLKLSPGWQAPQGPGFQGKAQPQSREIRAALNEAPSRPLQQTWRVLHQGGLAAPAAMAAAMVLAAGGLVIEALLFRGLFDIAGQLGPPHQRLLAGVAMLGFLALLLALELPILSESLRVGRHLETRLRMALLAKLPRLPDRYFQSRSVADMAERCHSLQVTRQVPSLVMGLLQLAAELLLTLAGMAWIAPGSLGWALAIALVALLLPLALQPWVAERDLRVRSHANALNACVMDVLQGLVPVRAHRAQTAMRRLHEQQLVAWARASRRLAITGLAAGSLQSGLCMAGASALLWQHFTQAGQVGGADLLLVYWVLKLPAIGGRLAGLLLQLPGQRNVLARLWEPLLAPTDASVEPSQVPASGTQGLDIEITGGRVVAAGHEILHDLQLRLQPGERVAIVGDSGAGKSTLMGLLMGWHRLAEGQVLMDGQAAGPAELAALRPCTAWVDPSVQLWNQPLMDNLHYATEPQAASPHGSPLSAVLDAADLRGVLQRLPQGLQTPLGEGGALLSGGEGQRVRLGRAMMQTGVRLVLLDEPFRGLDRHQRSQLLHNALQWWHGATVLCITHDVAETCHFDRVLVMRDGTVVEDGSPQALVHRNGPYASLLTADAQVQQQWWGGDFWRRVRIVGGQVATP